MTQSNHMEHGKSGLWKGRLNDDGLITEMYSYLWLATGRYPDLAKRIAIPDTILYERGFPKAWYAWERVTNSADGEDERTLRKRLGKDIAVEAIMKKFCTNAKLDVVAEYITLGKRHTSCPRTQAADAGGGDEQPTLSVQYLTSNALASFFDGRAPGAIGILQRHVPVNAMHNTSFEVIWSPLSSVVTQLRSAHPASETGLDVRSRYATVDADIAGRTVVSAQDQTRSKLTSTVAALMKTMSSTEGSPVVGVTAYCKIDLRGCVILQYITSIRSRTGDAGAVRDPLLVGADFVDRTVDSARSPARTQSPKATVIAGMSVPRSRPRRYWDDMRELPSSARVHLLDGGRLASVIVGEAYVRKSDDGPSPLVEEGNSVSVRERSAAQRLQDLRSASYEFNPPPPLAASSTSRLSPTDKPVTSARAMPEDLHSEHRNNLLMFLQDMSYQTRAHRERVAPHGERSCEVPFFQHKGEFQFRFPPDLARALGSSGMQLLQRCLALRSMGTLYDAHGHSSEYYAFPWAVDVATNAQLLAAVMLMYPPVVVRKGRRSVSRHPVTGEAIFVDDDDDDDDEDDLHDETLPEDRGEFISTLLTSLQQKAPTPCSPVESQHLPAHPNDSSQVVSSDGGMRTSDRSPLTGLSLGVSNPTPRHDGRQDSESPFNSLRSPAAARPSPKAVAPFRQTAPQRPLTARPRRGVDWRIASGFPKLPEPPRSHRRKQPLSALQREAQCTLSPLRKRIYYPEGQKDKPGPSMAAALGVKEPAPRDDGAPLSEAATQYLHRRKQQESTEDPLLLKMPFLTADATQKERRPEDVMMEYWAQ